MHADLPRRIAERLHLRDLLALEADDPRQHRIHHEGGDAEKNQRIGKRQRVEHPQLVIEPLGRCLFLAGICTTRAVGGENTIHLFDHRLGRRPGRQIDADIVESTVEIVSHGQSAIVHPNDTEALMVGQRFARPRLKDEFGRQADATDFQGFAPPVDHSHKGIARLQAVFIGERFAQDHFAALIGPGETAAAQEQTIQFLRAAVVWQ